MRKIVLFLILTACQSSAPPGKSAHILIVGTGYVGLVTGACLAEMGHTVICLDIDEKKIENLKQGIIPIYEPGLAEIVERNVEQHRLRFVTDYEEGLQSAAICFIAVPTPSQDDGSCDLRFVESAALSIAKHMNKPLIIVNKSTVPVGTAHRINSIIKEELSQSIPFDVLSNPEFLKEGVAVQDFLKPDRIVIGSDNPASAIALKEIYTPLHLTESQILIMDTLSAEMTKYAANAMLATRISFMNELANICKKVGANVGEVKRGIGSDPRIGPSFLNPGVGYGGSCLPKDVRALISIAKKAHSNPLLLQAVDEVNNRQKKQPLQEIATYFSGNLQGKTIAIWGLSFKPDTDDMREAPSLSLIEDFIKQGANLRLFDPIAMPNAKKILGHLPNITWCEDELDAATGADATLLLTEWKQFRQVELSSVLEKMNGALFFDGRNQYQPLDMKEEGFDYISIGVPDP